MFAFYIFLMLMILFLRPGMDSNNINLIPFKSIAEGINVYDGIRYRLIDEQVWGNVLIFIPSGIYIMILRKKSSIPKSMLTIFLLSLSAEVMQFIFKIGASDIDDIILNCLGGIIGILIYCLLKKLFKTNKKIKNAVAVASICVGAPILILGVLLFIVNYV